MKNALILIVLSIVIALCGFFIVQSESPFKKDLLQNKAIESNITKDDFDSLNNLIEEIINSGEIFKYLSTNTYLVAILFFISISFFISSVHLIIDKLFFKNFFEEPILFSALRRGFLFSLTIFLLLFFRLYKVESIVFFVTIFLVLFIEILLTSITISKKEVENEDLDEEINIQNDI